MVQATTLVAWLGVQDCRHIKEHAAGKGGVIFSALEQTGATRLVLLSVLQPSLTHAYLEALSLAWPGEIVLHAFDSDAVEMASLWPWAQQAIESSLPVFESTEPGHEPAFLLGTALPACQAVFLAHGMSGAPCRLIEARRDGVLQGVAVPRIVAGSQGLDDAQALGSELADPVDAALDKSLNDDLPGLIEASDVTDPLETATMPQTDGAPAVTEVPDAADWGVEEVALQPVRDLEFPEHLDDDLVSAGEHADGSSDDDVQSFAADTAGEPQIELLGEDTSEWNVEEVALKPVTDLEFDAVVAEETAASMDADFDLAVPDQPADVSEPVLEEPAPALDADFAAAALEEPAAASDADFETAALEEPAAASDADFETAALEEPAPAADDMQLEFPDVSVDALDFDAELDKIGSLSAEMPEKVDEIERLQAEFAAAEAMTEATADALSDFEALADDAPAQSSDPEFSSDFDVSAKADESASIDQDPFEAAKAALSDDLPGDVSDDLSGFESRSDFDASVKADESSPIHQDPFEAAQAALAEPAAESPKASAPHATPWPYASESLSVLVRRADTVAVTPSPVLILGEAGSGGRLLATRIHERSDRKQASIILADLAAIHTDAQGAELWGESELMTGAHTAGYVELAQGGTLLLAGLELMTPLVQSQLLNLIVRGDYMPVGAQDPVPADVRVIAVASDTLLSELKAGRFNRQLFDQFGRGLLTIPALHKRQQDLPALLDAMWFHIRDTESRAMDLSEDARQWLVRHGFTGTVRDLELALRRAVLWTREDEVNADTLKESLALASIPEAVADCSQAIQAGFSLKDVVFSVTKHFVHQALVQSAYDLDEAAALLGVADSQALLGWMARVDIVLPRNLDEAAKAMPQSTFDSVSDEFVSGQAGADVAQAEMPEQTAAGDSDIAALAAQIDF